MEQNEKHHMIFKEALTAAYRAKEEAEISASWQIKTMNHIRHLGPLGSKADYLMNFEQLVWRLAPVVCALILVFSIGLLNIDFAQEYEIAKLFVEDPVEYAFIQSFGI